MNRASHVKAALLLLILAFGATQLPQATASEPEGQWEPENALLSAEGSSTPVKSSVEKMVVPELGDGETATLKIESDGANFDFLTVKFGALPASSEKKYRAVYYVLAQTEEPSEGLYLMLADLADQTGAPLNKDYHKLPVANRAITGKDMGGWVKKEFAFTVQPGTEYLSATLVYMPFKGSIQVSPIQLFVEDEAPQDDSKKKTNRN